MAEHNIIGQKGEEIAAKIMRKKGFRVIDANWKFGNLEMDLIAANRKEIAFVEVKTRTSCECKRPEENVDQLKRRRMVAAANAYIKMHQIDQQPRFDIIGILMEPVTYKVVELTHLEDVFLPPQRTIGKNHYSGQNKWHHRKRVIGR